MRMLHDRVGPHAPLLLVPGVLLLWVTLAILVGPESPWPRNLFRWDAFWYETLWQEGYALKPHLIAYPPLYPLLVGALSTVSGLSFGVAALLLNSVALVGACAWLGVIFREHLRLPSVWGSLGLLCTPALYFVLAPYADALFLYVFLHSTALLLRDPQRLSRRQHLILLALLLCAPLIRVTGLIFVPLVLLGRWHALAAGAGAMIWFSINHSVAGHPLAFIAVQQDFGMPAGHGLDGLQGAWRGLFGELWQRDFLGWQQRHLLPLLALALAAVSGLWLAWRRQWALLLLLLGLIVISHNQSFWRSVVRYDIPLWPFLFAPWLAGWQRWGRTGLESWRTAPALLCASVVGLLLLLGFAAQITNGLVFLRGGWTF